tara:strand:- start:81 stop:320 length:240 start_codon:yes stop_codon:yes gene_type:complete
MKKESDNVPIAVYINPRETLPGLDLIKQVIVLAFTDDKLLMIENHNEKRPKLPEITFDTNESLDKTVRREIYAQTGSLI